MTIDSQGNGQVAPRGGRHAAPPKTRSGWGRILTPFDGVMRWAERGAFHDVAVRSVGFAIVVGAILAAVSGWDWAHVRGRPVEHARVVKAIRTGETESCGKSGRADIYELTWISENPPPGLPAEFTNKEGCDRSSVGDANDVVRVVHSDGSVRVWDDPIATQFVMVLVVTCAGLVLGYAVGVVWGLLRLGWRRWRARRG